tara:strand:- start:43 stop:567 length:525 start_codon:yes stop_codon:yes gene_type:complete
MANRIPLIVNPAASQIQEFNESTDSLLGAIPIGGIIMWSGKIADIPTNYALCNGSNGTPDLRNKFVIAAHSDQTVGVTTAATTITGSNTVTGGDKDAVLASHTHGYQSANHPTATGPEQNQGGGVEDRTTFNVDKTTTSTGINASGTTKDDGSVSATNANLPPYFALAYIMRTT